MKNKGMILFWTDLASAITFMALIITGAVLNWILPHGMGRQGGGRGGQAQFLAFSRHDWGELHFWIAAASVVLLVFHVAMHVGWVTTSARRYLMRSKRSGNATRSAEAMAG